MPWQTISEADLLTKISGAELDAFRSSALATGQDDPVAETINSQVLLARGFIAACRNNKLGAGPSIPDMLVSPILDLIVMDVMSRSAGIILDPDGQRRRNADKAMSILRDVSACRVMLPRPTTPTTEQIGYQSPTLHTDRRPQYNRNSQNGI